MDQYASSVMRNHAEPGNRIASSHDIGEQGREIRALQRRLAERIRAIQRGARHRRPDETA